MLTISNFLSLLRAPLALLFLSGHPMVRLWAILGAMLTDGLDGFIARRYRRTSQLGAFLDPLMDKFFVLVALTVFLSEGRIVGWQALSLLTRDFAVMIFGLYLVFSGRLARYQFHAIWSGKITTFLQFGVLIALSLDFSVPTTFFACFVVLGALALMELSLIKDPKRAYIETD